MKPDDYEREIGPLTLDYHAAAWQDMAPHVDTLTRLASTVRSALELGVRGAVSTWVLLDGLPADGRLWSLDAVDHVAEELVPRRVREDARWTFLVGDDMDPAVRGAVPAPIELVLIDTSHEYVQTLRELGWCHRLGASVIVLHDWNQSAVADAACLFAQVAGYTVSVKPSLWGLGVLRR